MGYTYKIINNRKILVESLRLKSMKIAFLRKYLQYKEAGAIFIFQNGTPVRRWINENDPKSFPKFVSNTEGARFIVLHAGSKSGFLEGCELIFNSRQ
jgi:hypothetical protein